MRNIVKTKISLFIVALILLLPVAAYIYQFGIGFWERPEEWSNLGGYIGGVYAPLLTLLTLSVLCVQIYLQMHQHRQHLVSLQEAQLTEYLTELNKELEKELEEGITLRNYLISFYNPLNFDDLNNIDLSAVNDLNQAYYKLFSMWAGVNSCLSYIKTCSNIKNLQSTHYPIQINKVMAYMGPQICSSLDKHNFALLLLMNELAGVEDAPKIQYVFWKDKSKP